MDSGLLTVRRGRSSIGPPGSPGKQPIMAGMVPQDQYDDFRRKHSRQNREIVAENVKRMTIIRTLQDEIASLQAEIFQLREENSSLRGKLTRSIDPVAGLRNEKTITALGALLSALPVLQSLHDTLTGPQPRIQLTPPLSDNVTVWRNMGQSIATNPAAIGAGLGLVQVAIPEGEEVECHFEFGSRRKSRGRKSGMGSVANRSPRPPIRQDAPRSNPAPALPIPQAQPPQLLFGVSGREESPESPTPVPPNALPETVLKGVSKRRRESGMLDVPASEPKNGLVGSTATARGKNNTITESQDPSAGLKAPPPRAKRESAVTKNEKAAERIKSPEPAQDFSDAGHDDAILNPADIDLTLASALSADDDIGRGRRARKSVNYKEPAMNKKMRKPDGLSFSDALASGGRMSMSGLSSVLSPTKEADEALSLPISTAHFDLPSFSGPELAPTSDVPDSEARTVSRPKTTKAAVLAQPSGMRRKSALPKSRVMLMAPISSASSKRRQTVVGEEDSDEADEDGLDDALLVDDEVPNVEVPRSLANGPGASVKKGAAGGVERVPTPIPPADGSPKTSTSVRRTASGASTSTSTSTVKSNAALAPAKRSPPKKATTGAAATAGKGENRAPPSYTGITASTAAKKSASALPSARSQKPSSATASGLGSGVGAGSRTSSLTAMGGTGPPVPLSERKGNLISASSAPGSAASKAAEAEAWRAKMDSLRAGMAGLPLIDAEKATGTGRRFSRLAE